MTYSVVAATADGEVGGASASCISGFSVGIIYGAVPGVGVVHAQARLNQDARDEAVSRLGMGQDPATIIAAITDPGFDTSFARRQFLIATPETTAVFTGDQAQSYAGHRRGVVDGIQYGLAGNILTGAPVLDRAEAAFTSGGCDLAERFVLALEAGAENGEGDSRCTPDRPATSAYLRIESSAGAPRIELEIVDSVDPLGELRTQYDAWRAQHPCPEPPGEGGAGGAPTEGGGGSATSTTPADTPTTQGGCSMGHAEGGGPWALALLLLGILATRRRAQTRERVRG